LAQIPDLMRAIASHPDAERVTRELVASKRRVLACMDIGMRIGIVVGCLCTLAIFAFSAKVLAATLPYSLLSTVPLAVSVGAVIASMAIGASIALWAGFAALPPDFSRHDAQRPRMADYGSPLILLIPLAPILIHLVITLTILLNAPLRHDIESVS
jgi:hypothetical protein